MIGGTRAAIMMSTIIEDQAWRTISPAINYVEEDTVNDYRQ